MPLDCGMKQRGHCICGGRSSPSFCATQGTVNQAESKSSSASRSVSSLLGDWHKVTDCSVQQWCVEASDYEKRYVAKFLGRVTAGKDLFERQLRAALEQPSKDPTVRPDQTVRPVYRNMDASSMAIRKRWRPDYIIHPDMISETIAVRSNKHNWPIPPSRALH